MGKAFATKASAFRYVVGRISILFLCHASPFTVCCTSLFIVNCAFFSLFLFSDASYFSLQMWQRSTMFVCIVYIVELRDWEWKRETRKWATLAHKIGTKPETNHWRIIIMLLLSKDNGDGIFIYCCCLHSMFLWLHCSYLSALLMVVHGWGRGEAQAQTNSLHQHILTQDGLLFHDSIRYYFLYFRMNYDVSPNPQLNTNIYYVR